MKSIHGAASQIFGGLGYILGVCPCCNRLFYLSDTRIYIRGKQPHSIIDEFEEIERKLDLAEQKLENKNDPRNRLAVARARKRAENRVRKIDPLFHGAGYSVNDVHVIFDPVTFIVFDGLRSSNKLEEIVFLAHKPTNQAAERIQRSISGVIRKGNFEFQTLHIDEEGRIFGG